jgi:23S rRNA (uracil1939-C5)-methyltransferase
MDISSCPVHPRPVNQVVQYLKRKILELGIAPYDERDDSGDLRYVDFRYSFVRRDLSVTLITRHASFTVGGTLASLLQRRFPFVTGVIQNVNKQRGNVIWGDPYRTLAGRDTILEQIGDLKLVFPAGVFSQANPFAAAKLYEKVGELTGLTGKETVLDLYCGVGPISLSLARNSYLVCGIDDDDLSISTAKQNARRNGIANCRFLTGDVAEKVREATQALSNIDLVILNPPRKGLQPAALDATLAVDAAKMMYVSCEPHSLARDLDKIVEQGYRILRLQSLDMFPQTEQVETVVLLGKA